MSNAALVLSGGGARGAYQAGVIRALVEIFTRYPQFPFPIVTGVSAGAINGAYLAAHFQNLHEKSHELTELWGQIRAHDVFRTDLFTITGLGWSWARDLLFGGLRGRAHINSLLDVSPLRRTLTARIPFDGLERNLGNDSGLNAFEVSATDYSLGMNVSFYAHRHGVTPWTRVGRKAESTRIGLPHIMASSAIPLFFPPVTIEERAYGDGCLRNATPLSPAIKLGADKIMIIGVRHQGLGRLNPRPKAATVGRILSVILNSLLFEAIDQDLERLNRVNHLLDLLPPDKRGVDRARKIEVMYLTPSMDLGEFAAEKFSYLPKLMQYMMRGLGSQHESSELVSYLLFEREYTARLVDLGYQDTMEMKDAIQHFMDV